MKCLETRRTPEGFKRRRYQQENGLRLTTIEVPIEIWNHLNAQGRSRNRLEEVLRVRERNAKKLKAIEHMVAGWKAIASANEIGVPVRTIERWRKEKRDAEKRKDS